MSASPETTVTIKHKPHSMIVVVKAPSGRTLMSVDAPPKVALRTLADYMRTWANRDDAKLRDVVNGALVHPEGEA